MRKIARNAEQKHRRIDHDVWNLYELSKFHDSSICCLYGLSENQLVYKWWSKLAVYARVYFTVHKII